MQKTDIVFMKKGSQYQIIGNCNKPYHFIVVSFDLSCDSVLNDIPFSQVMHSSDPPYYITAFRDLANTWCYKSIAYKLKCKAILQDILYRLIHDFIMQEMHINNLSKIQDAVCYMENWYHKTLRIEELAEMVNLSVSHFRRQFKNIYRISPIDYLSSIRINKAKDLILSDMYSMGEIAEKVGYPNVYYFSRVFKKYTGYSPTVFKKRL